MVDARALIMREVLDSPDREAPCFLVWVGLVGVMVMVIVVLVLGWAIMTQGDVSLKARVVSYLMWRCIICWCKGGKISR